MITCIGAQCIVDTPFKIVLGQENIISVSFEFNDEWDELSKEVYISDGFTFEIIPLFNNILKIPSKFCAQKGHIYIGVAGIIEDTSGKFPNRTVVLTTNIAYLAQITQGPNLTPDEIKQKIQLLN